MPHQRWLMGHGKHHPKRITIKQYQYLLEGGTQTSTINANPTNPPLRILIPIIAIVILLLATVGSIAKGQDYQPALWALQLELSGDSAYGEEMDARFQQEYAEPFASGGFAYPLPVMWLALPILPLPEVLIGPVWCIMSVGSVLIGLYLLRMPFYLVFLLPLPLGMYLQQITVLLVGLLLIGIWAWQEKHWWLLSIIIALTIAAKPQTTLLIAGTLAVLTLRAGAWRPLLISGGVLAGLTFALEPNWMSEWFHAVQRFRAAVGQTWIFEWIPIALILLLQRKYWSGLAVLQVALFPTLFGYTLLPLLVAYVDSSMRRFALLAVVCSWIMVPLVGMQPISLFAGFCFLGPLLLGTFYKSGE